MTGKDKWAFAAVTLLLLPVYVLSLKQRHVSPEAFLIGDCFFYRGIIDSILTDGDLLIANNVPSHLSDGQLAAGRHGLVPKHPIFMSLAALPFYKVAGTIGLLAFNLVFTAGLFFLIYAINRLFFSPEISAVTTFLYASTTLFLNYAYNFSPDVFSTVFLLGGFYLTCRRRYGFAAVVLGLSIFAKVMNILPVTVLMLYLLYAMKRDGEKGAALLRVIGLFLLSLVPFLVVNHQLYGSPFVTGYNRAVVDVANGAPVLNDHSFRFHEPLLPGIWRVLFDHDHGLFPTNKILIAAVGGLLFFPRVYRDKFAVIFALCAIQTLMLAKYAYWYGGSHHSNRFMMPVVALSSVFFSQFLLFLKTYWQGAKGQKAPR